MVLADMQFAEKVNKILSIIVKKLVSLSKKYCEKRKSIVKWSKWKLHLKCNSKDKEGNDL